jgi:ketosteroid isomerase-like protein
MSKENVEVIRRLYRAMDARDVEAVTELSDPAVEWVPDSRVGEGPVRGREQVGQFFERIVEMFDEIQTEIEGLWDPGDKVLAFIRVSGSGVSSGARTSVSHVCGRSATVSWCAARDTVTTMKPSKPPGCRSRPGLITP